MTQLDEGEKMELLSELNLGDTLFQKSRFYNATNPEPNGEIMATDNPSYSIFVKLDTLVRVSVYGYISSKEYRKRFPSQVLKIHDFILNFDADKYIKWVPEKLKLCCLTIAIRQIHQFNGLQIGLTLIVQTQENSKAT